MGQGTLKLQKALKREGFDPGPLDGIPGRKTAAAELAYKSWWSTLPEIIDISRAQGTNISWAQVKAAGVVGVYLKATEGLTFVDPCFRQNLQAARTAGLLVGAYHVTRPKNDEAKEAKHFAATVKAANGGTLDGLLIPMLDIEVDDANMKEDNKQVQVLIEATRQEWQRQIWGYSYGPFIYGHGIDLNRDDVDYWHAEYCGDDPPTHIYPGMPNWKMHQYAGNNGRCPGVPVACDRNKFRGTVEELRAL